MRGNYLRHASFSIRAWIRSATDKCEHIFVSTQRAKRRWRALSSAWRRSDRPLTIFLNVIVNCGAKLCGLCRTQHFVCLSLFCSQILSTSPLIECIYKCHMSERKCARNIIKSVCLFIHRSLSKRKHDGSATEASDKYLREITTSR